jgi:hypothetical protein
MRKLILAITTMLVAATCAAAAVPNVGVRFNGTTNAKVVSGFGATVTFLTGKTTLKRFSFGTLGCFGYGNFPVGVDPYGISIAQLSKAVPFTVKGAFTIPLTAASYSADPTITMKVGVTGVFRTPTSASGTITVTESGANGGTCGPYKTKFTAQPGH